MREAEELFFFFFHYVLLSFITAKWIYKCLNNPIITMMVLMFGSYLLIKYGEIKKLVLSKKKKKKKKV
jgi:hypothetical protein